MLARQIQTVDTSSCGRLFDAVSSLLGIRHETTYEGQAAIELEAAASTSSEVYPFRIEDATPFQIDLRPLIEALVSDITGGIPTGEISARFHLSMARVIAAACELIRNSHGLTRVCLSGGTFQNLRLLTHATALLREQGFEVFLTVRFPPTTADSPSARPSSPPTGLHEPDILVSGQERTNENPTHFPNHNSVDRGRPDRTGPAGPSDPPRPA